MVPSAADSGKSGATPSAGASVRLDGSGAVRLATSSCFLATLVTVTWEKAAWEPGGYTVTLADIFGVAFLLLLLLPLLRTLRSRCARRPPATVVQVAAFTLTFVVVSLAGAYGLETRHARVQLAKGLVLLALHFSFLTAGLAYVAARSRRFFRSALVAFVGGITVSAVYGAAQFAAARLGYDLDGAVLSPLTHRVTHINVYGTVGGLKVYRPNALSGDSNHLAIMLDLGLLVLVPLFAVRAEARRVALLGFLIAGLLIVELATLSRSGLLGLVVGLLIVAVPYRRTLLSPRSLGPLALAGLVVASDVLRRPHFYETVLRSRLHFAGNEGGHFGVYRLVPHALDAHPLFGVGLNNFAVFAQHVTGKAGSDAQSVYVAILVESGVVGTLVFLLFLSYVFVRLNAARVLGARLLAADDPGAVDVRALAWGSTAAVAATMAANVFYLTMTFFYFYAFLVLALGVPLVFGRMLDDEGDASPPA